MYNLHKDMKTYLLDIEDKHLLNRRSLIESVFKYTKKPCAFRTC
ncbi:transposase [Orientia tsutsugamushi]